LQSPAGFSVISSTDRPAGVVEMAEQPTRKRTDTATPVFMIIFFSPIRCFWSFDHRSLKHGAGYQAVVEKISGFPLAPCLEPVHKQF
jgi:hypothetical protein